MHLSFNWPHIIMILKYLLPISTRLCTYTGVSGEIKIGKTA